MEPTNYFDFHVENESSMPYGQQPSSPPLSDITQYINPDIHGTTTGGWDAKKRYKDTSYKTVMCQTWLENGSCPFNTKCRFAHGEHELRHKNPSINCLRYKTKLCDKYTTSGICPYGNRCLFIHPTPRVPYANPPSLLDSLVDMPSQPSPASLAGCPYHHYSSAMQQQQQMRNEIAQSALMRRRLNSGGMGGLPWSTHDGYGSYNPYRMSGMPMANPYYDGWNVHHATPQRYGDYIQTLPKKERLEDNSSKSSECDYGNNLWRQEAFQHPQPTSTKPFKNYFSDEKENDHAPSVPFSSSLSPISIRSSKFANSAFSDIWSNEENGSRPGSDSPTGWVHFSGLRSSSNPWKEPAKTDDNELSSVFGENAKEDDDMPFPFFK